MLLSHLIEKFDDVSEVHVSVNDDVSVGPNKAESYEEIELRSSNVTRGPYCLPDSK